MSDQRGKEILQVGNIHPQHGSPRVTQGETRQDNRNHLSALFLFCSLCYFFLASRCCCASWTTALWVCPNTWCVTTKACTRTWSMHRTFWLCFHYVKHCLKMFNVLGIAHQFTHTYTHAFSLITEETQLTLQLLWFQFFSLVCKTPFATSMLTVT